MERSDPARTPRWQMVSPTYFATMGIRLLRGRLFTDQDDAASPPVVIVSAAMARSYWPGQDPLGKRIASAGNDTTMMTVVGVVGDVRSNPNNGRAVQATFYMAMAAAHPWRTMSLVVRTRADPAAMAHRIARGIASVAPMVAPGSVLTLAELHDASLAPQRITSEMMAAFAVVALLLAGLGLYGVMSYSVAQRRHDIGVRSALGAQSADILRDVLGTGMRWVTVGIVLGVAGAALMTRGLAHLLTQIRANDPGSFGAAIAVLAAVALVGSYLPARRAIRVDPSIALRRDA